MASALSQNIIESDDESDDNGEYGDYGVMMMIMIMIIVMMIMMMILMMMTMLRAAVHLRTTSLLVMDSCCRGGIAHSGFG